MAKLLIKLNRGGVKALLTSGQMESLLRGKAQRIASVAGPGHEVHSDNGPNRARAEVVTVTMEARRAEARDRNLTRAIGGGR